MFNNFTIMKTFNIRVYGILKDPENNVLVSDEWLDGRWCTKFPGGGLEWGEGTKECLIREFMEETGLEVTVGKHIYTTDFFQLSAFNKNHQMMSVYYEVNADDLSQFDTLINKDEILGKSIDEKEFNRESFRWVNASNLHEDGFTFPIDKYLVKTFLKQ